ncbi:hypothetical protein GYN07_25535 (plasmid) [Rhizobium leguminosarum bv. viciae 248]|uniref:hypothetical protein n=1 Tax=Rhizobium leguminosarum TaxID=384 RepID=UPI000379F39A|nr:hypothetical protein [Rhizobium leguminosarum]MCA2406286.1 hypothetical protein [Rhizobium leguminosarum]NKM59750.1 hypothetical protein [Rhizobium leguminosarum bv. viciae]QHW27699.1 hypothetical protein GYN07_25535 [Rhizobium leguminosarum bv. viciae 248]
MSKGLHLFSFGLLFALAAASAEAACTVPNQIFNGGVVDSAPVTADFNAIVTCLNQISPAGVANSVQLSNGSGGFSSVGPLTNGQLLIGSGGAPVAADLTAGTGIAIVNSPGGVTISTTGTLGGGGADWLNGAAVVKPTAANFTLQTSTIPPTGAAITATPRGMTLSATAVVNNTAMMAEMDAPAGHWQATMLGVYTGGISNFTLPSIAVRDVTNNRSVEFGISGREGGYRFDYFVRNGGIGFDSRVTDTELLDIGFPHPAQAIWQRLTYDGTNLIWSFSRDGEFFIPAFSIAAGSALTNLNKVGPAIVFAANTAQSWPATFHVLSWDVISQ